MIEYTSNYYTPREVWQHLTSRFKRKPNEAPQVEVLQPVPTWSPRTELERTVFAALFLAGEPVNNRRLAELMGCHRVKLVAGSRSAKASSATRKGREVLISLN